MFLAPSKLKQIHFVGIGGIGMSGIAEILHHMGYNVTGSDIAHNNNIERLSSYDIPIALEHRAENIFGSQVIVKSSAITDDNPEILEARECKIPVLSRAEMLSELIQDKNCISISGTHGKTTTTSLVAQLLETAQLNPTVVNGGIISSKATNAYMGMGQWCVLEADESDGSLLDLSGIINVVTNIDPEHLDYYGTFDNLIKTFTTYIEKTPFYGTAIACSDHPVVAQIIQTIQDRRIVTYGYNEGAQIRAHNVRFETTGTYFDVTISPENRHIPHFLKIDNSYTLPETLKDLFIPMFGPHNVLNALVNVAVAFEMGLSEGVLTSALKNFQGVKRRFTNVGTGAGMDIIDDYAHHPVEIANVVKAAKQFKKGKVIAVMQPHRYSRLSHLMQEFAQSFVGCDEVIVAPVYGAGETPIANVNHTTLANQIAQTANCKTSTVENLDQLSKKLFENAESNTIILCLGAGSISAWAHQLPDLLNGMARPSANKSNLSLMMA